MKDTTMNSMILKTCYSIAVHRIIWLTVVLWFSVVNCSTLGFYGADLDASCNRDCQCSQDVYNPVCGIDGILYYSPCYAGCQTENGGDEKVWQTRFIAAE